MQDLSEFVKWGLGIVASLFVTMIIGIVSWLNLRIKALESDHVGIKEFQNAVKKIDEIKDDTRQAIKESEISLRQELKDMRAETNDTHKELMKLALDQAQSLAELRGRYHDN